MRLKGKQVLLGITGSIAAYKAAEICRLLRKEGADVRVIMTHSATQFINPLTFSVLSDNEVRIDLISETNTWNNHVEMGLWGDLFLIAPASANTISKMVSGLCDNLLMSVYLSARCPVMIAPAMDHDMFLHASTTTNIEELNKRGVYTIGPAKGELASGLVGEGRLEEPVLIVNEVVRLLEKNGPLKGKKALVTAGQSVNNAGMRFRIVNDYIMAIYQAINRTYHSLVSIIK